MKLNLFLAAWLVCCQANSVSAEVVETFEHIADDGYKFAIKLDGIEIQLGDKTIAAGKIKVFDGSAWFYPKAEPLRWNDDAKEVIEKTGEKNARLSCEQPTLSSTLDFTFQGQDVLIKARLENNSDKEIEAVGIELPPFRFEQEPTGYMPSHDANYIQNIGIKYAHPSHYVRMGGTHASDQHFGVGATPWKTGLTRSLLLWETKNASNSYRALRYLVPSKLPMGGAMTIQMVLRVSRDRDWKHLLKPYQQHFVQTLSTIQYDANHRPFVQFAAVDKALVASNNPFGFNGNHRRFDTVGGTISFGRMVMPGLHKSQAQGVMFWALGGYDQRGAMYRPDFDIFPKAIEDNLPLLRKIFADEGKIFGLCTRPGEMVLRANREQDMTLQINPDDSAHLEMIKRRFDRAVQLGFTAFYLDSFGCTLEDVKTMIYLRKHLGRSVQTYAEMPCDWILPFSGVYMETIVDPKSNEPMLAWFGEFEFWEKFRYLVPDAASMTYKRLDESTVSIGTGSVDELLYRNHLTPMSEDWRISKDAERLRMLNEKYLDDRGQWR
jgi:hypothetical protein